MALCFFKETIETKHQVTNLFDFLWPTAAAMWNLRWQVQGFVAAMPSATAKELNNRFIHGSGIRGPNLRRSCIDITWEHQQEQFANIVLTNIFAIYESWIALIFGSLRESNNLLGKALQFPTTNIGNRMTGIRYAIDCLTTPESTMLKDAFYSHFINNKKYSFGNIDNLLLCYRYFKEIRNAYIHNGGIADSRTAEAYDNFKPIANKAALGVAEVPHHYPAIQGQTVNLSLRGVVGLCDIVLRIVTTLDAELSRSKRAEGVLLSRWNIVNGNRYSLKSDPVQRTAQIQRLVIKLGLPKPLVSDKIELALKTERLVN